MPSFSCWISRIFTFATAVVVRFGRLGLNSSTFGFNFVSVFLTVLQCSSIGYNNWICRSRYFFFFFFAVNNPTALKTFSFPECNFYTLANFQCPRFLLPPFIITTSPIWMSASLSLLFRLLFSQGYQGYLVMKSLRRLFTS